MLDFIMKYWIQELFALIIAIITWLWRILLKRKNENEQIREAMMALLHDRLYKSCSFYIMQGFCSVEDRNNLEYLYVPYKALGGNGTGESLYKKCLELPLSADRNIEQED
ncbi:MAG: hypothetical protein ACI4CX_07505 [Candidatus Weimeria sp.]